jgi:hypothetical protein
MTAFFFPQAHLENLRSWGPTRSYADRMSVFKVTGYEQRRTGGSVPTYEIHASDVPCRVALDFIRATENTIGGQVTDLKRAIVYTAPDLGFDIDARDRLEIEPNSEETEPTVIDVTGSELRRTGADLERLTRGIVVGGRGTVTP